MSHDQPTTRHAPERGVLDAVAAAYGLPVATTPPRRLGGAINHVLRVSRAGDDVIVRIHGQDTSPDRLTAVHRVQEHLRAAGLPIPAILRTRDGGSWIAVDGRLVEVLEYVPAGHEVATWRDGVAIFAELGRLHARLRTVDASDLPPPIREFHATPVASLALLEATETAFQAEAGHQDYERAAATREATAALLPRLRDARGTYHGELPRSLVHGDFVGNNVLVAGDRVVAILDFDRLAEGDRIVEIARTLMYVLSRAVYPRSGAGVSRTVLSGRDLAAVARLVGAYAAASGWRLSPAELRALPFEMAGSPLFPIVAAATEPLQAIVETTIFAPHVPMAEWLVDHADRVSATLQEHLREIR